MNEEKKQQTSILLMMRNATAFYMTFYTKCFLRLFHSVFFIVISVFLIDDFSRATIELLADMLIIYSFIENVFALLWYFLSLSILFYWRLSTSV